MTTDSKLSTQPGPAPEERVLALWKRYGKTTLGRRFYSFLLGRLVPYSGTVRPQVEALEPGFARVSIRDRRPIRNHLRSVHAIALANIGELASGLALIAALPQNTRAIVTGIDIVYSKKARGPLTATGEAQPPEQIIEPITCDAHATINDSSGDPVATITAHWLLSPREHR